MRKYGWIALVVLVLDQLSKLAAQRLTQAVALIPGVLGLRYAENTGMAFGLLAGRPWLLGLLSGAVIIIGLAALRRYQLGRVASVAAMLMLGGAVGNMLDRLFRGYVIDMFEALFVEFAVFNVADAALTLGCGLMIISLMLIPKDWSKKHGDTEGNPV